jgi:hypothetical protein
MLRAMLPLRSANGASGRCGTVMKPARWKSVSATLQIWKNRVGPFRSGIDHEKIRNEFPMQNRHCRPRPS